MDNPEYVAAIRDKMRFGLLPTSPTTQIVARPSDGRTCDGCGLVIGKTSTQDEFTAGDRSSRMHLGSFAVWSEEVSKVR